MNHYDELKTYREKRLLRRHLDGATNEFTTVASVVGDFDPTEIIEQAGYVTFDYDPFLSNESQDHPVEHTMYYITLTTMWDTKITLHEVLPDGSFAPAMDPVFVPGIIRDLTTDERENEAWAFVDRLLDGIFFKTKDAPTIQEWFAHEFEHACVYAYDEETTCSGYEFEHDENTGHQFTTFI